MADNLVSISHWFGLSMLFAGCTNILVSCKKRDTLHGSKWIFVDGLSTALLSFFLLFNQIILPAMIPFFDAKVLDCARFIFGSRADNIL